MTKVGNASLLGWEKNYGLRGSLILVFIFRVFNYFWKKLYWAQVHELLSEAPNTTTQYKLAPTTKSHHKAQCTRQHRSAKPRPRRIPRGCCTRRQMKKNSAKSLVSLLVSDYSKHHLLSRVNAQGLRSYAKCQCRVVFTVYLQVSIKCKPKTYRSRELAG